MTIRWFGKRYNSPAYREAPHVPIPVGETCTNCLEPIKDGEDGWLDAAGNPFHRACWYRNIIGSLAHVQRRCSCYIPGSTASDPLGLTAREAAEAVLKELEKQSLAKRVVGDVIH